MDQPTLFDEAGAGERSRVSFTPTFDGWRAAARDAICTGVSPDDIWWSEVHGPAGQPCRKASPTGLRVPRTFIDLARFAACHRSSDRWALLYEILWRLQQDESHLMQFAGDPAVVRLDRYAKSVRRDLHKMKAFLRFREVHSPEGTRYVAWFEPEHHIVDLAADFFRRRFTNMRWSVLTPDRCAHWEAAGEVRFSPGVDRSSAPDADRLEAAWQSYYRSTFNPSRVKVAAMQSEMPQKYWRNLPEAAAIGSLLLDAPAREQSMLTARAGDGVLQCGPRPNASERIGDDAWSRLRVGLESCTACGLCERATQVVPGEGDPQARIMLIGEQPGDEEDLTGRPFVGPAGRVLDDVLEAIGVDRASLYLTNAVKHFRFRREGESGGGGPGPLTRSRGKRRLHERPREGDIHACRPWLDQEMALVQPERVVCLGRTAARAVTGRDISIDRARGRVIEGPGYGVFVTVHPAAVLRAGSRRAEVAAGLRRDLETALIDPPIQ